MIFVNVFDERFGRKELIEARGTCEFCILSLCFVNQQMSSQIVLVLEPAMTNVALELWRFSAFEP